MAPTSLTMSDAAAGPVVPAFTRALVHSDGVETEYLRAGHGPVVVYLGGAPVGDAEVTAAVVALAAHFRVVVPRSTSALATVSPDDGGESAFARWLRGVLEGLGIVAACFVVEAPAAREVAAFARANPGVVERLVLLGDAAARDAGGTRMLALSPDVPHALDTMLGFLSAPDEGASR